MRQEPRPLWRGNPRHEHTPQYGLQRYADHRIIREASVRYPFEHEDLRTMALRKTHIGTGSVSDGGNRKGLMAHVHEANDLGIVHSASNNPDANNSNHNNIDGNNSTTSFQCEKFKASIIYAALGSPTTRPTSASSITSPPSPPNVYFPTSLPPPSPMYTTPHS